LFVATQGEVSEWSVPYASTESPIAPVATYNGHSEPVHALAISPAHSALYTASGKEVREFPLSGPPTRIASRTFKCHGTVSSLHPTGDKLFAGCGDKTVREHDLRTGLEKTWKLAGIFDRAHPVPQVSLSSDSRSLFAALGDGVVRIDLWSDERIGKIRAAAIGERDGGSADVLDFATSPDGRYLVSAGSDGMAREHLIATGITTRVFNHGSAVRKVRVFEGRLFTVSATETKEWDLGTGECKGVLRTGGVDAVLVVVGVKRGEGVQGEVRRIWVGGEQGVGEWAV
jgi:WD40 repeat protein